MILTHLSNLIDSIGLVNDCGLLCYVPLQPPNNPEFRTLAYDVGYR